MLFLGANRLQADTAGTQAPLIPGKAVWTDPQRRDAVT